MSADFEARDRAGQDLYDRKRPDAPKTWAELGEATRDEWRRMAEPSAAQHAPVDTWQAVVADRDGFVLDDETLRAWCKATEEGKTGWAIPCEDPESILIVTGTARPVPQSDRPDEDIFRLPGTRTTEDRFLEIDISSDDPGAILRQWERVRAAAAAMNAAGVQ